MRITIKNKNAKRLASLSALGAGALALGVPVAEAGIIYTPVNGKVGFSTGFDPSVLISLPGTAQFNFARSAFSTTAHVAFHQVAGYVVARTATYLRAFPYLGAPAGAGQVVAIAAKNDGLGNHTNFDATNKYFVFVFTDTNVSAFRWAWGELAVSFTGDAGPKPDVTLVGYTYEDSGAVINAGDLGPAAVPEPSSLVLSGLGALILGASGIRRWRAARQS